VYFFDCSKCKGDDYSFAHVAERNVMTNKKVIELSRNFICEKVCLGNHEWDTKLPGREVLNQYLANKEKARKDGKLTSQVVFLDHSGEMVSSIDHHKQLRRLGTSGFLNLMKQTERRNRELVTK
jgi:hypothetical protein